MTGLQRNQQSGAFITNGRTLRLILMALIGLGFALRLHAIAAESLWYDELLQLDIAQLSLAEIFPRLRGHSAVPLDYVVSHLWIMLGRSDGWVRLPAVLVGTLTLPVTYHFGRVLVGRAEGLLLTLLLVISPFHIRYSQEVRPYAWVVLGVTLAGYAFWQLRSGGGRRYIVLLQIGVLVALLSQIFAAVIFVPFGLFLLIDFVLAGDSDHRRRVTRSGIVLLLTTLLPLTIFFVMGWGDVLYYTSTKFGEALVQPEKIAQGADPQASVRLGPQVDWPFVRQKMVIPFAAGESDLYLLFVNFLLAVGFLSTLARRKFKAGMLLVVWLLLPPVILVTFLIYRQTFFAPRYIISVLPVYLLLLSAGVVALPRWLSRRGWSLLAGAALVVLGGVIIVGNYVTLSRQYEELTHENWRLVSSFIAGNAGPDQAVIAFHAEPTMNWYYPPARAAPNVYRDLSTIQETVAQNERSWVILSIFSSPHDAQVKAWLSEQQAVRFVLDPMIHVYYLGMDVPHDQLLTEIQEFALPVDHALYASLARENRRRSAVARQYYRLAIEHAPDESIRAEYKTALDSISN